VESTYSNDMHNTRIGKGIWICSYTRNPASSCWSLESCAFLKGSKLCNTREQNEGVDASSSTLAAHS
jgi:hypothetical protein